MKPILSLSLAVIVGAFVAFAAKETSMDWNGLSREKIDLKLPLLLVKGSKGLLACGYLNVETCNRTQEACAIVSGVQSHDDMLQAEIKAASEAAKALGVQVGMKGSQALELFR